MFQSSCYIGSIFRRRKINHGAPSMPVHSNVTNVDLIWHSTHPLSPLGKFYANTNITCEVVAIPLPHWILQKPTTRIRVTFTALAAPQKYIVWTPWWSSLEIRDTKIIRVIIYWSAIYHDGMMSWWLIITRLITVKPVCNDHLYNKMYYLWLIQ